MIDCGLTDRVYVGAVADVLSRIHTGLTAQSSDIADALALGDNCLTRRFVDIGIFGHFGGIALRLFDLTLQIIEFCTFLRRQRTAGGASTVDDSLLTLDHFLNVHVKNSLCKRFLLTSICFS